MELHIQAPKTHETDQKMAEVALKLENLKQEACFKNTCVLYVAQASVRNLYH